MAPYLASRRPRLHATLPQSRSTQAGVTRYHKRACGPSNIFFAGFRDGAYGAIVMADVVLSALGLTGDGPPPRVVAGNLVANLPPGRQTDHRDSPAQALSSVAARQVVDSAEPSWVQICTSQLVRGD